MKMNSPWVVALTSLPHQEGAMMQWELTQEAKDDMRLEMIGVEPGTPIHVQVSLSSVSEGVWVSGSATVSTVGECARCLRPIADDLTVQIGELVYYPHKREALIAQGDEDAQEAPIIEDDHIDLEPIVRDSVLLSLPLRPLCRPDCRGLCPECGIAWDELPEDHHHEKLNPAFDSLAALEDILRSQEEKEA